MSYSNGDLSSIRRKADSKGSQLDPELALLKDVTVQRSWSRLGAWILISLFCILTFISKLWPGYSWVSIGPDVISTTSFKPQDVCPQASPLVPSAHGELLKQLEKQFTNETWRVNAYELLGGAVRIPTEAYDDFKPPGEDPRWDIFAKLHEYLEQKFPLVHSKLQKTAVNTYALVYHWQGTDPSLKPILLTAHQDVVPVPDNTIEDWIYPPYSGTYDGKWIWGRGSCDDKPGLIGSLTAVEILLQQGFQPARSVVLAYGIDEERGGLTGATAIRDHLLSTYGENSFSILIDEGGGNEIRDDIVIATPAIAEKGHFDLRLVVSSPGGHSSVPPPHTSIGILGALIVQLEANPHAPHLYRNDTYYTTLQCQAAFDPDLDDGLRSLIKQSLYSHRALSNLESKIFRNDLRAKALGGTTQAVDIIRGGVKVNALPEEASAIVNHRIAGHSSVSALKTRITTILLPTTEKYNLSLEAFGEDIGSIGRNDAYGHLSLSDAFGTALEPAPITPTTGSPAYEFLSGTIVSTLKSSARLDHTDKPVVVAPGISTGNTDTRYYWKLTKNIFRYGHINKFDTYNGAHTINEALVAEGFVEVIRFFTRVILNADDTNLLD